MNNVRILLAGIGGIGGVVAGKMREAGYSPVLVTKNAKITEALRRDGLRLVERGGERKLGVRAFTTLEEAAGDSPFDAAYLIMKATGVVEAAVAAAALLAAEGYVVTFQNGIVEDAVGEAIGVGRVVSGIIGWGATMHAPGVYEKTTPGKTFVGELDGSVTERVRNVARAVETSAPTIVSTNMRGVLWSKLAINCTINSVGALTGETLGEMLHDRRIRQIFLRAYSEVVDLAEAQEIRLEPIAANPKLLYVAPDAGALTRWVKDVIVRILGRKYRGAKSSTLQSLERGRKTEVEFLNGFVVREAERLGISVPVNAALYRMIPDIESGARKIGRKNVEDLVKMV